MRPEALEARRAIEALRSGVPSRAVVEQLGTTHTAVEDAFRTALEQVKAGESAEPVGCVAPFGQGKTHLIIHLRALAEREGFATSHVVVSPETPLGNPVAVLSEICRNASVEGRVGDALSELHPSARTNTREWAELRLWAREAGITQRFQALMYLFEELTADVDFLVRILEDIQGKPISQADIRRQLKALGQSSAYDLRGTPRKAALAPQRIRVLARWFRAFGRHGLIVFFDELERLGSFSAKQRMAAYEQVAWWCETAREEGAALLPVWFSTHDLDIVRDRDLTAIRTAIWDDVPPDAARSSMRQLLSQSPRWRGWEALSRLQPLDPLTREELRALQARMAELYERAYGMDGLADLQVQYQPDTVRQEIRRWIAYWDMQRLYSDYVPDIRVGEVETIIEDEWNDEFVTTTDED
ncbi:MAG: DUF2791 family P-loop domain-containing protein [Chthonomonadales bacterium]|nr:DUF2791 family P-loop domain-containing protein [Chthonomonadales bacterium]